MSTIGLIHSTRLIIEIVHNSILKADPGAEIIHLLDEGLLKCLQKKDIQSIQRRLFDFAQRLEENEASLIIITCSSLSCFVNEIQNKIRIPIIKIDEPMLEWAVNNHDKIGVIMTNPTTYEATSYLIEEISQRLNKKITVAYRLCHEAFNRLTQGDFEGHDKAVAAAVQSLLTEDRVEVVLLAQISIARVMGRLDPETGKKVFSSLDFIGAKLQELKKG